MTEAPRLLMAFRADEVAVGDYLTLPFGPAEVIATERTGNSLAITARIEKAVIVGEVVAVADGEPSTEVVTELVTFTPMAHELVCLWEKR